ncbi:response regulator transcription factor [Qipengyuania oceanensis]|uniref:Helix-turn-helix transcriptional regulator n=1 Tax=Qipengyuania oceanensis TaxID=1463597 RepID=A0A844YKR5_9SPHN|nr:LuxR C-terminal-related transcriptional regulator [Qipengyuania oceanensis]MXO64095.1 hypothetical protein [Qipengyuania oceanensis]
MSKIHVVDDDVYRRNQMAKAAASLASHAEIYENFGEFKQHSPCEGLVLVSQAAKEEALKALMEGRCPIPAALYACSLTATEIKFAFRAGFIDVLVWPSQEEDLADALKAVILEYERRSAVAEQITAAKRAVTKLSRREAEVLSGLVSGASNKEMAVDLGLSHRTIEIHRANALKKMGARSTVDAVRIGMFAGLLPQVSVSPA